MKESTVIAVTIVLSFLGGLFKVLGGVFGGSKSVFVDALTSIVNTLAIVFIYVFYRESLKPPDRDHPFGHFRLAFGGPIATLMLYSFVLGLVVEDLIHSFNSPYEIKVSAPIYAAIGMIPYSIAIAISKKAGFAMQCYAHFTVVELLESFSTIASSAAGIFISFWIDYGAAVALSIYLVVELWRNLNNVIYMLSDYAPQDVVAKIVEYLNSIGFHVERIRIRKVFGDIYHGDAIVKLKSSNNVYQVHDLLRKAEEDIRKRFKADIYIKIS